MIFFLFPLSFLHFDCCRYCLISFSKRLFVLWIIQPFFSVIPFSFSYKSTPAVGVVPFVSAGIYIFCCHALCISLKKTPQALDHAIVYSATPLSNESLCVLDFLLFYANIFIVLSLVLLMVWIIQPFLLPLLIFLSWILFCFSSVSIFLATIALSVSL